MLLYNLSVPLYKNRNKVRKTASISLLGGFGNNLFQIALAKKLEIDGYTIEFDLSAKKCSHLELDEVPEIADFLRSRISKRSRFLPNLIGSRPRISKFIIKNLLRMEIIVDLSSNGNLPLKLPNRVFLCGYWQNIETAKFLPCPRSFKIATSKATIAIHVRRGDMQLNLDFPLDNFFRNALKQIHDSNPGTVFKIKVFTDDQQYCKKSLFLGYEFEVNEKGTTIEDFLGMLECEYLVISRSTYSWWAAYFSTGTVYCPLPWDVSGSYPDSNLILDHWKGILVKD
jgi:Glycosyl transferase family 11